MVAPEPSIRWRRRPDAVSASGGLVAGEGGVVTRGRGANAIKSRVVPMAPPTPKYALRTACRPRPPRCS